MKNISKVLVVVLVGGLSMGSQIFAARSTNKQLHDQGVAAINHILSQRDSFRERVEVLEDEQIEWEKRVRALENEQNELETLLAGQEVSDGDLVARLSAVKKKLEDLFAMDNDADKGGMDKVIEKLSMLNKEVNKLFPDQNDEGRPDLMTMFQKLSHLRHEIYRTVSPEDDLEGSRGGITQSIEQLSSFREDLEELFPKGKAVKQSLQERIRNGIEQYTKELEEKENAMRLLRKEARKIKKELKEVKGYFLEIVQVAKQHAS